MWVLLGSQDSVHHTPPEMKLGPQNTLKAPGETMTSSSCLVRNTGYKTKETVLQGAPTIPLAPSVSSPPAAGPRCPHDGPTMVP